MEDEELEKQEKEKAARAAAPSSPQGPLDLSDRLPPLDERLTEGRSFSEKLFTLSPSTSTWYKLPAWLAGVWTTSSQTLVETTSLRIGRAGIQPISVKDRETVRYGMQKDREGVIWHWVRTPRLRKIKRDDRTEYRLESERSFAFATSNQLWSRCRSMVFLVENFTGMIVDAHQEESLDLLARVSDKKMHVVRAIKAFDWRGVPASLSRTTVTMRRIRRFEPVITYARQNMPALFREYLAKNGMSDLAPEQAK